MGASSQSTPILLRIMPQVVAGMDAARDVLEFVFDHEAQRAQFIEASSMLGDSNSHDLDKC